MPPGPNPRLRNEFGQRISLKAAAEGWDLEIAKLKNQHRQIKLANIEYLIRTHGVPPALFEGLNDPAERIAAFDGCPSRAA